MFPIKIFSLPSQNFKIPIPVSILISQKVSEISLNKFKSIKMANVPQKELNLKTLIMSKEKKKLHDDHAS